MKIFKPKDPVKTLIAILFEGEHGRAKKDRALLWEIRYHAATGKRPRPVPWPGVRQSPEKLAAEHAELQRTSGVL